MNISNLSLIASTTLIGIAGFAAFRTNEPVAPAALTSEASTTDLDPEEARALALLAQAAQVSESPSGYIRVELDDVSSSTASQLFALAPELTCGGAVAGSGFVGGLPACGSTPAQAQANALRDLFARMTAGYACPSCPSPGRCGLGASFLPEGLRLSDPVFIQPNPAVPLQRCPGQWLSLATYMGPYLITCGPCEL